MIDAEKKTTNTTIPSKQQELKTPAEWVEILKVKHFYLAGVSLYAGWKDDQKITRAEFERKLSAWLSRPIGKTMRRR